MIRLSFIKYQNNNLQEYSYRHMYILYLLLIIIMYLALK